MVLHLKVCKGDGKGGRPGHPGPQVHLQPIEFALLWALYVRAQHLQTPGTPNSALSAMKLDMQQDAVMPAEQHCRDEHG